MSHFATTAFIRKRAAEKHTEKHIEKAPKINEKIMKNHLPFRTRVGPHFGLILGCFLGGFGHQNHKKSLK